MYNPTAPVASAPVIPLAQGVTPAQVIQPTAAEAAPSLPLTAQSLQILGAGQPMPMNRY